MRRGVVVIGVFLVSLLAGCGGGSSTPSPSLGGLFLHTANEELEKHGASQKQIACVDRHIEAMSAEQMAERVVEGAPAEKVESESEAERLGALGKGCF